MLPGILVVFAAAFFQGTFMVPLALTKNWKWEHNWAVFCFFGMLVMNWAFGVVMLPNPAALCAAVPSFDLYMLALFGVGWGVGVVLFGLGMDKLGLTLGYPLIMGLNAALGALTPLLLFTRTHLLSARSLSIAGGTALALAGIVTCSLAGKRKNGAAQPQGSRPDLGAGLAIAVAAGALSCLPNIGLAYGKNLVESAGRLGAPASLAGSAVWEVFLTCGALVNLAYCGWRIYRGRSFASFRSPGRVRNMCLVALASLLWISSLYLYGSGATQLGTWGTVVGWPVFISVSIIVGVLWGLMRREWTAATPAAFRLLADGLALLMTSVVLLATGNSL